MSENRLMTVESLLHVPGRGTLLQGVIERSSVRVGDRVEIRSPSGAVGARVMGIERTGTREFLKSAAEGEDVCFLFESIDFSKLPGGVEFDEEGGIHLRDLCVTPGAETSRWWEFWK